jgi:hypothetical protein
VCKHKKKKTEGKHRKAEPVKRVKVKLDEKNPAKRISKEEAKKTRMNLDENNA